MAVINRSLGYSQKGLTLIELLISLVVFSIALLGLAALQTRALSANNDARLRSTAALLTEDMADRMRSNIVELDKGITSIYNNAAGANAPNPNCLGVDATGTPTANTCSSIQMAQHDFYEWQAMISGQAATSWHPAYDPLLPGATGITCIDSTPNDGDMPPGDPACDNIIAVAGTPVFAVKLWWNEKNDATGTVNRRFVMSLQP